RVAVVLKCPGEAQGWHGRKLQRFCANTFAVRFVQHREGGREALDRTGGAPVKKPVDPCTLKALRAGCPAACAEVVRTHYQQVYRFLVHLCRNVHRAEDLTQETFAAAWEKIATFQGRATLATWLHRIAYTKYIDAQRAERRVAGGRQRLSDRPAP